MMNNSSSSLPSRYVKYFWETDIKDAYKVQERFNLLLLEPTEIYFEDYSVYYYPTGMSDMEAVKKKRKGRLKICSHSLLFEPLDASLPILKILYRDVVDIKEKSGALLSRIEKTGDVIIAESKVYISMKEHNIISPYQYHKIHQKHFFCLNFVNSTSVLPAVEQLLRAHTLSPLEAESMISAIVASRQANHRFNTSWIEDLYEEIIYETTASKIAPLICNPGRVLLTSKQLYFQPFNNIESKPVLKLPLSKISSIIKRRYLLRHVGMEFFQEDEERSMMYLIFSNSLEREKFYQHILAQEELKLTEDNQENMTLKWQSGALSNFDYLLFLNSQADRSFNDLTQYPVFPWIIQDYESSKLDLKNLQTFRDLTRPMGALNEDRLHQLQLRSDAMPDPKFLYGSHYSTPGFVLYYLVRVAPEYMLCLQNGKFDNPDRLFNSIKSTWINCCTGHSDFKELIPEFYMSDGSFLCNSLNLSLGFRQDGHRVHDVHLPSWAKDAPDFISKCREALESDYVSQHLNEWIDLIFGYKQQGEEAWKANNVFYYLTYEGAVDLDSIESQNERKSYENQILEFGQTPKQLFTKAHPKKMTSIASSPVLSVATAPIEGEDNTESTSYEKEIELSGSSDNIPIVDLAGTLGRQLSIEVDGGKLQWISNLKMKHSFKLHKNAVNDIAITKDATKILSVSQDCQLKLFSLEQMQAIRSFNISNMALSCCRFMDDEKHVLIGAWDNKIYIYSLEYSRIIETLHSHNDAVSQLCFKHNTLISAGWDTSVYIWLLRNEGKKIAFTQLGELDHETEVTACDLHLDEATSQMTVVTGTKQGCVTTWNVDMMSQITEQNKNNKKLRQEDLHNLELNIVQLSLVNLNAGDWKLVPVHSDTVTEVLYSADGQRILSCGSDGYMKVLDVQSDVIVYTKNIGHPIRCAVWDDRLVVCGLKNGSIILWNLVKEICHVTLEFHQAAVNCISLNDSTKCLVSGDINGVILYSDLS